MFGSSARLGALPFRFREPILERRSAPAFGPNLPECLVNSVGAEHSITFELRFAEPLIECGLVRKLLIGQCVIDDVDRFVPVKCRFHVNENAIVRAWIDGRIPDCRNCPSFSGGGL